MEIVDHILSTDYRRYEFLFTIKYALKYHVIDKDTEQLINSQYYLQKKAIKNDINQLNQIKQRLLWTELTELTNGSLPYE